MSYIVRCSDSYLRPSCRMEPLLLADTTLPRKCSTVFRWVYNRAAIETSSDYIRMYSTAFMSYLHFKRMNECTFFTLLSYRAGSPSFVRASYWGVCDDVAKHLQESEAHWLLHRSVRQPQVLVWPLFGFARGPDTSCVHIHSRSRLSFMSLLHPPERRRHLQGAE